MAATRLDRLVSLLDSGSTPAIKSTAARQLGQIASQRVRGGQHFSSTAGTDQPPIKTLKEDGSADDSDSPANGASSAQAHDEPSSDIYRGIRGQWDEALHLCSRIVPFLHSRSWDTREAAALAIECICKGSGVWDPSGCLTPAAAAKGSNGEASTSVVRVKKEEQGNDIEDDVDILRPLSQDDYLSFANFDLPAVMKNGQKLLSSTGKEYDILTAGGNVADRLAQAKADMAKMGLGGLGGVEMDLGLDVEAELKHGENNSNNKSGSASAAASPSSLPPPRFAPQSQSRLPPPKFAPSGGSIAAAAASATPAAPSPSPGPSNAPSPTSAATPMEEDIDMSKLSARERNQLKRKRKLEGKSGGGGGGVASTAAATTSNEESKIRVVESQSKSTENFSSVTGLKVKTPSSSQQQSAGASDYLEAGNAKGAANIAGSPAGLPASGAPATQSSVSLVAPPGEWPFAHLTDVLLIDLFSPKWETRHGACLSLRSIFTVQGLAAGKSLLARDDAENDERKARWAADAAVKLICLLTLDRLSDFVFDQVVAPVREVAAQALSALLPHLSSQSRDDAKIVLLQMTRQDFLVSEKAAKARLARRGDPSYSWEVRHAGLSGLRWIIEASCSLAKREDQDATYVEIIDVAMNCLRDTDDDVRAVASSVLLPLASDVLVNSLSDRLPRLLDTLWTCLGDLKDDLNSSSGSVMDLLAILLRHQTVIDLLQTSNKSLASLIPLTYPFMRHTISSVRLSVLKTMQVFLSSAEAASSDITSDWLDSRVFRLLFQNLIVEEKMHIREATKTAWDAAVKLCAKTPERLHRILHEHLPTFLRILMTPLGTPFDFSLFFNASSSTVNDGTRYNVDKSILNQDLSLVGVDAVIRGRLSAAQALGAVVAHLWRESADDLLPYLESASALQKCLAASLVQEWAESQSGGSAKDQPVAQTLSAKLLALINGPSPPTWSEMAVRLNRLQSDCQALFRTFQSEGKVPKPKIPTLPTEVDPLGQLPDSFTPQSAQKAITTDYDALVAAIGPRVKKAALPVVAERRAKIIAALSFYNDAKEKQDMQVFAAVSGALIALKMLPAKLNPVIRSIMNSVKFEENVHLQQRSAASVASLVKVCRDEAASVPGKADPSPKIIKNLCAFVCQDTTQTAVFTSKQDVFSGILSLTEPDVSAPASKSRSKEGRVDPTESEEVRQGKLIRRGAEMALQQMATRFDRSLFEVAATLWDSMYTPLADAFSSGADAGAAVLATDADKAQGVLDSCTLIEVLSAHLSPELHSRLEDLLPLLLAAVQNKYAIVRTAAARCLGSLADSMTQPTMIAVVQHVMPLLGDPANEINRQGAIEVLSHVVQRLDIRLLPYVVVLIVPILGRMSDSNDQVRLMATNTFATLIKMVPLEAALPDPPGFPAELLRRRDEERKFLSQLLDGNKVEPYEIPVAVNAELRKYQREGISWMNFLANFQLHGVLCDDMGLGKTLQSICILAAKHWERDQRYKETKALDAAPLPSIVICPPTLTSHWCYEIEKYSTNLKPLLYSGVPGERALLQGQIKKHDVVVMSYDVVRNDIGYLSGLSWNYCILDEGHVIKSSKTKTTKAVKMIRADHRLILTGTPIQNNVLELWSLFDFLMPGFLGTERTFMERFGRPILATKEGKASAKEQEAATLALESLHKQVLPFLLRRLKDDVLDDLPPKIIQDVECDLGTIQQQLYDEYSKAQALGNLDDILEGDDGEGQALEAAPPKQHVFQNLQYLRKLVNHPALIFNPSNSSHKAIQDKLTKSGGSLRDISHAPKLETLMQLLHSCGIGASVSSVETDGGLDSDGAVSQHRVLIFCQMKQMMDIIEKDLFQVHMPSISYMRLDGSVPSEKRHGIVQTFNSDPSIDVLLLTTQVGGLGLTLTGADTVIFVEHDWNPMKDLQAMDRAHRLGQKKVVNVYRLITKNTLESKIMGLQQFKLNVANTIISQQNAGLDNLPTDQVLDLFSGGSGNKATANGSNGDQSSSNSLVEAALAAGGGKKGALSQRAILAQMESMGDTGQDYENMSSWRPS
ncbi:unnamed protein product [Sympodiomycopsis kandeliae]